MAIGIVRALIGTTTARNEKGEVRVLKVGDAVEANEVIQAAAGSTVHIAFNNGNFATVGSNESLMLDMAVVDPEGTAAQAQQDGQSVADIQALIAEGADPTEIAEATAAGADAGTAGDPNHSGSHSFVVVDQVAARGNLTPGFETTTFANPVPDTQVYDGALPDANDAPVIDLAASDASVDVVEAGVYVGGNDEKAGIPVINGQVVASDPDGDTLSYVLIGPDGPATSITTDYGTITLHPDGSYTYELDNGRTNSLAEGEKAVERFTVEVSDGRGGTAQAVITVNVTGSNDIPSLEVGKTRLVVTDDGATVVEGAITDAGQALGSDPDAGHTLHYSFGTDADGNPVTRITDEYGTLTINPDTGEYTYTLDKDSEAVQKLSGHGDDVTQRVTVTVTDEYGAYAERPLDILIRGANDVPVMSAVTEHVRDTGVYGDGAVSPDTPTADYTGPDGDGHIRDGEHRTEANGQLQGFDAEGDALSYGVDTSGMAAGETIRLVNPDNDGDTTTIRVLEVSTGDGTTTIVTEAGTFVLNADGSYRFSLNTEAGGFVDSMGEGQRWNLTFDVSASDGELTGHSSLTVCIEGANETPVFTQLIPQDYLGETLSPVGTDGAWVVTAAEHGRWRGGEGNSNREADHSDVISGRFEAADRDTGASLSFSAAFQAGLTSGKNADKLGEPGSLELIDVEEKTFTEPFRLADYADKHVNNDFSTDQFAELPAGTYQVFHFEVGDLYIDVNTGQYYFNVHDDSDLVNRMNLGDTHTLNFSVTVTDEHGASSSHDFTINIEGRNDRPVLAVTESLSATDGQTAEGNLLDDGIVKVSDADFGDSHTFWIVTNPTMNGNNPGDYDGRKQDFASNKLGNYGPVTTLEGKYGILTVHPDGSYTYKLYGPGEGHDDAYQAVKGLGVNDAFNDEIFHIAVEDSHGAFDIQEIAITVNGVNDAPVVNGFNVDVKEDGTYLDGKGGMHDTGLITDPAYQGFIGDRQHKVAAEGNVFTDKGHGGKPIVSDTDANDKLTVDVQPNRDGNGDIKFTLTGVQDGVDAGGLTPEIISNVLTDGIRTIVTNYGTLTLNTETGEYRFELSDSALGEGGIADRLAQGQKLTLSFVLTATDESGQSARHIMGINIQGANDAPVMTIAPEDRVLDVYEKGIGSDKPAASGTAVGIDDDYGAKKQYSLIDEHGREVTSITNEYGALTIDPDTGEYTFTLNNDSAAVQGLNVGDVIPQNSLSV